MSDAIVLLSGGLDSATALYYAKNRGWRVRAMIFDYRQRHKKEIPAAKKIAERAGCPFTVIKLPIPPKGSSLVDKETALPARRRIDPRRIPSTYVPARNIVFLSFGVSYAEARGAEAVFIGANAVDYSGYPDCRPEFFRAFGKAVEKGTKSGVRGKPVRILTPLIRKTKAQIIRTGTQLGVPYHLTWSCYRGGRKPCGVCDSCRLRARGFREAGIRDPL